MKLKIILPMFIVGISFMLFSFQNKSKNNYEAINTSVAIDIPENIQAIISNKCMGCHSNKANAGKSKMKMNFDKFTNGKYSNGKIISKLGKITKMLSLNKMPPRKFLEKYPDKKLTDEESKLIIDWATEQGKKMKGE